jgi:membrane fusion protein, copper/silver efflux system
VGAPAMRTSSVLPFLPICALSASLSGDGLVAFAVADAPAAVQYHCPMHPSFVQHHMSDCPACGMKLVPVRSAGTAPGASDRGAAKPTSTATAGAMPVSAEKQKVLGLVVTSAERAAGVRTLRVLGRVAPDEARLYRVNAGVNGSMRDVSPVATGSHVKKNQILGSFYAPDTIPATQLFILNTQGLARKKVHSVTEDPQGEEGEDETDVGKNNSTLYRANVQQRIIQLENFGISAMQRDEIMRQRMVPDTIKIVSPADGFVLARNVSPGQKFDRGFELYRIADLRKVWVIADVFPQDARYVRPGQRAQVCVPAQDVRLPALVTEILPQFDAAARTLKVKLALDNPGYALRPDMFVDVNLAVELPSGVVVPSDAVVDSGLVKRVFVQRRDGVFEPRAVETGWRSGDQVQIVNGLTPGERVVTSGTFFLDSETRMRPPPSGAAAATATPVPTGQRPRGGAGASLTGASAEEPHALAGDAR